jgi:hypothetical protein
MKGKAIRFSIGLVCVLGVSLLLFQGHGMAWSADKENHCFTCHTSARKLIQITREIAETKKAAPSTTESEGEG